MKRRWGRLALAALATTFVGALGGELACSTFSSNSDPSTGDDDGGGRDSAAEPDRDARVDAASAIEEGGAVGLDASLEGGPNVILNGDFELGCANWVLGSSTNESTDTVVHGGLGSCRICGSSSGSFSLGASTAPILGTYLAEVWLRTPDDAGTAVTPSIQLFLDDKALGFIDQASTDFTPTTSFQKVQVLFAADGGGTKLHFFVIGYGTGCLIVDDAYVHRL